MRDAGCEIQRKQYIQPGVASHFPAAGIAHPEWID
jgi:hypothetical protein